MNEEHIFRAIFIVNTIALMFIRLYYQSKVLHDERKIEIKEDAISLTAASIAALTSIVFGLEYIFAPGFFAFTYVLPYPEWLRWLGSLALTSGVILLGVAHQKSMARKPRPSGLGRKRPICF